MASSSRKRARGRAGAGHGGESRSSKGPTADDTLDEEKEDEATLDEESERLAAASIAAWDAAFSAWNRLAPEINDLNTRSLAAGGPQQFVAAPFPHAPAALRFTVRKDLATSPAMRAVESGGAGAPAGRDEAHGERAGAGVEKKARADGGARSSASGEAAPDVLGDAILAALESRKDSEEPSGTHSKDIATMVAADWKSIVGPTQCNGKKWIDAVARSCENLSLEGRLIDGEAPNLFKRKQ